MQIIDYRYQHGTEDRENYIAIPELDRQESSVRQFIKLANLNITLQKPTAFIYVDGFCVSQAEHGILPGGTKSCTGIIRSGSSFVMHEWIYTFKGKEHLVHANIVSSTCAAGIQALQEAQNLLDAGVIEEVIIIGAERTTEKTLQLFKELRIPIKCGDGFFFLRLGKSGGIGVKDVKWKYTFQGNPFFFPEPVLSGLAPEYPVDFVKLHGTGTVSNTAAEAGLASLGVPVTYKDKIGHTQGISSLLETCMALDDNNISGTVLVTANGLGGFYGAFTVIK